MLLKTVTVALLLVALLDQSSASQSETPATLPKTGTLDKTIYRRADFPSFLFTRKRFGTVRLFAGQGYLYNFDALYNVTRWHRLTYALNDIKSVAITQNTTWPVMSVAYPGATANFGPYKSTGEVDADLGSNIFNLTVNATQYTDNCVVRVYVKLVSPQLNVELDLDDLDYPGALFGKVRSLVRGIKNTIVQSLKAYLEPRLSYLLEEEVLPEKLNMNMNDLCQKMISSDEKSFPEPLFD